MKSVQIKKFIQVVIILLLATSSPQANAEKPQQSVKQICEGMKPAIASDASGNLCLAFEGHEIGKFNADIMFVKSANGGITWSDPVDISKASGSTSSPDIAIDNSGAIDVVWSSLNGNADSPDICFARSTDGGKTWSPMINIATTAGVSSEPAIAIGPDNKIHVVWSHMNKEDANRDIFYSSSEDGQKWGRDELLPAVNISNTVGASTEPTIAVGADSVPHVAWLDTTSGENRPDIFYTAFVDGSWSKVLNVSNSSKRSAHPTIACGAKNKVYLSWSDNSRKEFAQDIWCAISNRRGRFEKPINISGTTGVSSEPAMSAQNGILAVVWTDTTKNEKSPDIWGRISNDFGSSFTNATDLGNTPGISSHPNVSIDGRTLSVVWQETQGLSNNLLFRRLDLKSIALVQFNGLTLSCTVTTQTNSLRILFSRLCLWLFVSFKRPMNKF